MPGVNYISELIRVIMFGCLDGQPFTNQYGPDPKGRELVPADANSQETGGTSGGEMANIVELQRLHEELLKVEAVPAQGARPVGAMRLVLLSS